MVVYINSERMGSGADDLGALLMKNLLATLADFVPSVSHIALVNSAVKLVCRDSPVLADMEALAGAGIEIISCQTCLVHFELMDELKVGKVSNMFNILDAIAKADKVLTP